MAIVSYGDSAQSTSWDRFKYGLSWLGNSIRETTYANAGLGPSARPIKDGIDKLMGQWIRPIAHDAKQVADRASQKVISVMDQLPIDEAVDAVNSVVSPGAAPTTGGSYSSLQPAQTSGKTAALNYVDADLAAHYGMDAKAAYSEALQNTAYQRAVADLKKAGLNPVLAAGSVSPAGSFAAGNTLSGGSGSGSSGGKSGGNSGKYAFDSNTYNLIGVTGTLVGALAGVAASPNAPVLGASTGAMLGKQLTQSLAQAVSSASRK